jgi:hypothetical protein
VDFFLDITYLSVIYNLIQRRPYSLPRCLDTRDTAQFETTQNIRVFEQTVKYQFEDRLVAALITRPTHMTARSWLEARGFFKWVVPGLYPLLKTCRSLKTSFLAQMHNIFTTVLVITLVYHAAHPKEIKWKCGVILSERLGEAIF